MTTFSHNVIQIVQKTNGEKFEVKYKVDELAAEVPVALVYNGISHAVMMCTPQYLEEFALGFSLAEGIIQNKSDIYGIDIIQHDKGIEVLIELSSRRFVELKSRRRSMAGRTGCGICGIEQLEQAIIPINPLPHSITFLPELFPKLIPTLQNGQVLTKLTGAMHAAAFFSLEGEMLIICEDIGRHVALDKMLGWYLKSGRPQGIAVVTSRASYEMVQKTASAGIEILVAMSAASEFAVNMAKEANLTLVGFLREGRATIYNGEERLLA